MPTIVGGRPKPGVQGLGSRVFVKEATGATEGI